MHTPDIQNYRGMKNPLFLHLNEIYGNTKSQRIMESMISFYYCFLNFRFLFPWCMSLSAQNHLKIAAKNAKYKSTAPSLTPSWRITYAKRPRFCDKLLPSHTQYVLKAPFFSVSPDPQEVHCKSFYKRVTKNDSAILSTSWFDIWIQRYR